MITVLIRTLITYILLILTMRLMGKRQIGELEVTDLVTTLLLSEIASLPITNLDIPVSHAVIPMITLLVLEVFSSFILVRFPRLKSLVSARPTVIIRDGVVDQQALCSLRLSPEELMGEVRQQGLTDLAQVSCAILEKNGKLTVLPKSAYAPPTAEQLGVKASDEALMHVVLHNGSYSKAGLSLIGKDRAWLEKQLQNRKLDPTTLFCVTANQQGALYWIEKDGTKK